MLAGTLEIEMLANMARLSKDMDDAKRNVGSAMSAIEKAVGVAKAALGGLAAGLSTQALVAYTQRLIDAADAMNDMSQRVGIAVKDLSKYELAAAQSGTTMEALAKGIKGIAVNLAEHGDALKKAGITATTADGAMRQLADVFAAMPDGMEKTTLAVKLFGKSGMDLIPMLNLGSAGLQDAAEKSAAYAEQMALLAPLADALNDNLAALATSSKTVGMAMINPFMPALVAITGQMAEAATQTGVFEAAIVGVGGALRVGWGHEIEILMLKTRAWLNELEAKKLRFFGRDDEAGAYMNAANNDYNAIKNLYANDPLKPKPAAPVDTSAIDGALEKYKALLAALKDNKTAEDSAAKATKDRLTADEKAYKIHYGLVMAQIQAMNRLIDVRNKDYDSVTDYMAAESLRLVETANASDEAVRAAQDEYDNHGKLQSAIAETTLARLQDQLVNKTAGTEAYASIARQVEAQRQLINILKNGEARDAAEDAAKELADANKKAAEDSSRYWEDALMRAFESGKSGWQSLWSTIKNTLQTQVLKIFLAPVVGGVSGMANAATGSGGASPFAAYGNPFTNFGGSMGNSIADFGTSMVDKGFTSLGTGIENLGLSLNANAPMVNAFGDALGYATALMAASDGKWGQAAGAAIGTYFGGPIGSAIGSAIGGMVDELFGGGGGPKTESGYGYSIGSPGNVDRLVGGATGSAAVYAKGIEDGWAALASKFGLASSLSVGAFTSTDPEGDALTQVQVAAGLDGQSVYSRADRLGGTANIGNVGRTPEELAAALQEESVRVLFAALKASNLDGEYTAYFASIGDSVAEMTAALDTVVLIKDFRTAMDSLPFAYLRDMSFDAAKGLLQAAGGLQAFGANLSGFYDNFYTESEKTANLTRNVTDALAAQNIVLPQVDTNLRAWYRSEVERLGAMDLSIAANAQAYASVLALQGSVAQLATGAETAAQSMQAAAQQIAEAAARLQADIYSAQDDAMSAYMSAQADYAAIVAQEQESAAQSMQAAAAATTQAADAIRSALASAGAGIATLIRDLTTTAGGTLDPMALARSTQAAYLDDLRRAQGGDVDASGRVAGSARAYLDASGAVSAGSRQAATVAQVVRELGQLPAVKTYEQQLLEAVQSTTMAVNTSSASNASTIAAALSTKLTAQLNVEASSQILKLINFVANTDNLPDDLKAIALSAGGQFQKTVNFITGSVLTEENKQLALSTASAFVRTFNFVAQSTLGDEAKKQAFAAVTAFDRVINIITGSELSEAFKAQAFNTAQAFNRVINVVAGSTLSEAVQKQAFDAVTNGARVINITATTAAMSEAEKRLVLDALTAGTKNISLAVANDALTADFKAQVISATAYNTKLIGLTSTFATEADRLLIANAGAQVTKLISAAVGYNDPTALAIAMAQTDWITKYVSASGGVLTEDQRKLLSDVIEYDKKVNLSINGNVSASQISSALAALGEFTKTVQLVIDPGSTGGAPSTGGGTTPTTPTAATLSGFFINSKTNEAVAYNTAGRHLSLGVGLNGISGVFANSANEIIWWDSSGTHHATGLSASFAQGANYLPSDMIAQVHAGERIIPAADNRELMARLQSPQANSDALASGLRAMAAQLAAVRAELAAIKANTQAGAVHQADSADSLRNLKNNGVQVWTDPAEPITTQAAP